MAGKGGLQRPANPAPVSGPGKMSQRTDGGPGQAQRDLTGGDYGDGKDFREIQSGAPMAQAPSAPPMGAGPGAGSQVAPPGDLFRASERPDEPLTEGAPFGPGAGPEALSNPQAGQATIDADMAIIQSHMPQLLEAAQRPDAPAGFKSFVRRLRNGG
jgi:hypothetical protein